VLGVEPARNVAAAARASGIETVERFFTSDVAENLRVIHGEAAAIVANNVLAHVDDPVDFLAGARTLLRPGGSIIIEVPYLADLIECVEYDTVYHEHLGYFSVKALLALADRVGLSISRIDRVAVHGGSVRVFFEPIAEAAAHCDRARAMAAAECQTGLASISRYRAFSQAVEQNRRDLRELLERLAASGRSIAAYGAPAKGNTLLNYCGIDPRLVAYTVDRNPLKIGRYTPGTHIPVLPVATLLDRQPDYVLLLAWNLADEIIAQQSEYRSRGGRFIVPVPKPVVM
jgi:hypothetical protein